MIEPMNLHKQARIHELRQAYRAAKALENRLELVIGWTGGIDARGRARSIRETIAAELIANGIPMRDFTDDLA